LFLQDLPFHTRLEKIEDKTVTMGIKQLFQIIKEEAPDSIKEGEIKNQFGRKVAIVSSPAHEVYA
jgi:hypothetical protein